MAMHLEQELGVPVSVINATGGKGVSGHDRGLTARGDGYTLTMMTFELNTMHWMGLTGLSYQDCQPLVSVNEDYAALLVRNDARWQSLSELEREIAENRAGLTASGTAAGGAWHLALAGWLIAADLSADDVIWVPSAGANPSLQQLMSGGVEMVCCSLPEARTLLEAGEVRALGLMSPERASGFEQVETFREQGRDWTLGGWRGFGVPKETPPEIVHQLVTAIEKIVSQAPQAGSFAEFMRNQKFDNTWRGPEAFLTFLEDNDKKLGRLLTSQAMRSVSQDRFSPMAYPSLLMGLMGLTLAGLFVAHQRSRSDDVDDQRARPAVETPQLQITNLVWIVAAVIAYVLFAERVGFLLIAAAMLFAMLVKLGTRPLPSLAIVVAFVPTVYFVFAHLLRVPLPHGPLG
jgi:tripartite-type tricarboxylate transporter receptor subunit TctC